MVYQDKVNFEAIRTAQIFLSTFTLVLDALHVCGLAQYKVSVAESFTEIKYSFSCAINSFLFSLKHPIYHDGVYYFKLTQHFAAVNSHDFSGRKMKEILIANMAGESDFIDACECLLSKH